MTTSSSRSWSRRSGISPYESKPAKNTYLLERLLDPTQPQALMVIDLLNFTAWLRDDMRHEEKMILHGDLLRDDVVGIKVNSG